MAAYKLNTEKKTITIDDSVKATAAEEKDIALYVAAGYVIKHKSKKRAANAAKRADGLSNADIEKALAGNKEALAEYKKIKAAKGKGGGFFAAKKWYLDNHANK